jgi:quinol monooxygenase YgiN
VVKTGLMLRLEARPGKEAEVERLLTSSLAGVRKEAGTKAWFAIRFGRTTFGVFNVFADETGRNAHLAGDVASRLTGAASDLLTGPPEILPVEILTSKLPR